MKMKRMLWIVTAYGGREMMHVGLETKKKSEMESFIV